MGAMSCYYLIPLSVTLTLAGSAQSKSWLNFYLFIYFLYTFQRKGMRFGAVGKQIKWNILIHD